MREQYVRPHSKNGEILIMTAMSRAMTLPADYA